MSRTIKHPDKYKYMALRMFIKVATWMDDKEFDDFMQKVKLNRDVVRVYQPIIMEQVMRQSPFMSMINKRSK